MSVFFLITWRSGYNVLINLQQGNVLLQRCREAAWLSRDNRAQGLELKIQIQHGVGLFFSCYTLRWSPLTEDTREQHSGHAPPVTPLTHRHKQPCPVSGLGDKLSEQGITLIWKLQTEKMAYRHLKKPPSLSHNSGSFYVRRGSRAHCGTNQWLSRATKAPAWQLLLFPHLGEALTVEQLIAERGH